MIKILFATDDTAAVAKLRTTLTNQGYSLDVALSGEEALQRARDGKPDAVLVGHIETTEAFFREEMKKDPNTVSIPVLMLTPQDAEQPELLLPKIREAVTSHRVLIAEDDRQMANILALVLEKAGYEIKMTHDGVETLREVKSWRPHMLVLDIMLPIVDGFHICQTLNEDHSLEHRPKILIISGRGSEWDQNLGAACGAEDYMVKPVNHAVFLAKVREILTRQ